MKRLLILCTILLSGPAWAMQLPSMERLSQPHTDAQGYHYKDENSIQDKRKIAILSYGSLVNQATNRRTGVKLEATPFILTPVQLPVSLSRISQDNRLTAVIDRQGELKRVYAAQSKFQWLPNARHNLAAREGASYRGQTDGYRLNSIFYMKKLLPGRAKDDNEDAIPNTHNWVIRHEDNERQSLSMNTAQVLAGWADNLGYQAIIWASFPPNERSRTATIEKLLVDSQLLLNTQAYVRTLPDGPQSDFEQAIMGGRAQLGAFARRLESPVAADFQISTAVIHEPVQIGSPQPAVENRPLYDHFTYFQPGDLPILLTAPHGGRKNIGVPKRVGRNQHTGAAVGQYCTVCDDGTLELTRLVSDALFSLVGARPYVVMADFTREDIDANRPASQAYEDIRAKPIYDFYHGKVKEYIAAMKQRFGDRSILIDIHGQGSDARSVFRGTRDRKTVARLIERSGEEAFTGNNSILGMLQSRGYQVKPDNAARHALEKGIYSGGYTVGTYGSHQGQGIDAIQLENGWELRRGGRNQFAQDLAESLVRFYLEYLAS